MFGAKTPTKPVEPVLTQAEADSPVWKKVKKHLEERIARMRERNDDPRLDEAKTAALRGAIKELKYLAALDNPAPQTEADDLFKD